MKFFFLFFFLYQWGFSQDGFKLFHDKQTKIPFDFINNQIILDVVVNDTPLKFILDTGVDETIIFSLDDKDKLIINNPTPIKFRGLGANEPVEGIKTEKNKIMIGKKYVDMEHTLYIIVDQDIDLTGTIGFPVNGIMGYQFFKNYPIAIDYTSKKIMVFQESSNQLRKKKIKYHEQPIQILRNKPFLETTLIIDGKSEQGQFLLDTGNSDNVWVFNPDFHKNTTGKKIHDFLGKGFSGNIFGHKFRTKNVTVFNQTFINPIITSPDESSIQNINYIENRKGSLGAGFISRYDIVFDYKNAKFYTLETKRLNQPFLYNRSGIEIVLGGTFLSSEKVNLNTSNNYGTQTAGQHIAFDINALNSKMVEKPIYSIQNVRDHSQAKKLGITKGDILQTINGQESKNMKLQDIIEILQSTNKTTIQLKLNRKGKIIEVDLPLEDIL